MDDTVWYVWDRNYYYYNKASDENLEENSNRQAVYPCIIGDCGFSKPTLSKKCYIGFGELCSICIEPIIYRKTAWLTSCGHTFHRNCLKELYYYDKQHIVNKYTNEIPCPNCREGLVECCMGIYCFERYSDENGLDRLENNYEQIEKQLYQICWKCSRAVGMNKNCNNCLNYRKIGKAY
jgi:Ring finger domain